MEPLKPLDPPTEPDPIDLLRQHQGNSSLRAFGETIGCSAAYLSEVYSGKREPGPLLLNYLGVKKETKVVYRWR